MRTLEDVVVVLALMAIIQAVVLGGIVIGRLATGRIGLVGASGTLGFGYFLWVYSNRHGFDIWSALLAVMTIYMLSYALLFWRYLLPQRLFDPRQHG